MQLIDIHKRNHQYQRCLNSILEIEMLKMLSYQSQFYNETLNQKQRKPSFYLAQVFKCFFYLSGPYHFKFFKGCLPQILLGSFLNTLNHMIFLIKTFLRRLCLA